jgi:hypothetical protein
VWFLFVGQWSALDAAWGAGACVVAGVVAAVLAARGLRPPAPRLRWARIVPQTLWQTLVDFGVVMVVLARSIAAGHRGPVGRFVRTGTTAGGTDPRAADRRAWLTAMVTWSPNAYVIDVDAATGRTLLHDLRPRRASEEPL